jgi:hypothetical protein
MYATISVRRSVLSEVHVQYFYHSPVHHTYHGPERDRLLWKLVTPSWIPNERSRRDWHPSCWVARSSVTLSRFRPEVTRPPIYRCIMAVYYNIKSLYLRTNTEHRAYNMQRPLLSMPFSTNVHNSPLIRDHITSTAAKMSLREQRD